MEITNRKSVSDSLKKYTWTNDENSFIEVTEWTNGEGWDINICDNGDNKIFSLHYGELEAINYLRKVLEYADKD